MFLDGISRYWAYLKAYFNAFEWFNESLNNWEIWREKAFVLSIKYDEYDLEVDQLSSQTYLSVTKTVQLFYRPYDKLSNESYNVKCR